MLVYVYRFVYVNKTRDTNKQGFRALPRLAPPNRAPPHLALPHLALPYLSSPYLTLPYLTPPNLALSHLSINTLLIKSDGNHKKSSLFALKHNVEGSFK